MVKTRKDLTGKTFGELYVLHQTEDYISPKGSRLAQWLCRCSCGNEVAVIGSSLNNGHTKSCGHNSSEFIKKLSRPRMNLVGERFGRLTVVKRNADYITNAGNHFATWICLCDCGNIVTVRQNKLIQGRTKSCGCLRAEASSKRRALKLLGKKFGELTVIRKMPSCIDKHGKKKSSMWYCECNCGGSKVVRGSSLVDGSTISCGCIISRGEKEIRDILNNLDIHFKTQYWFDDLRSNTDTPLYFDFAIIDKQGCLIALIEYQGEQHYIDNPNKKFGKFQREVTDKLKKEYCIKNKIKLFEIRYDEDILNAINNILKEMKLLKREKLEIKIS